MDELVTGLKQSFLNYISPSEAELSKFIAPWTTFEFEKNVIITEVDQIEPYFYYVHQGLIRGYFLKEGVEYNMGFSYNGEYSGVYDSFITQQPSTWTLETISKSKGLKISYKDLMQLLDNYKLMERWMRLFYQKVLVGFGIFTKSMLADSAEEKYNRLIKQSPHVVQLIPQKHLASYLGMTPETFSRMRKKVKD
ncbi:Crp/Fnr family transcriptional regulator [Roseivirga sp.]|uniref:Crp/Fnr family transcriptional regulator n=1 Tax=Roseivirga sp. TaxID=1964215 RepID=UPI003B8B938B